MFDSNDTNRIKIDDENLSAVSGGSDNGSGSINILIRDLQGRDYHYTVNPETTIYELKLLWIELEDFIPYVRLIYRGKELDNSGTIASYQIPSGTTIHAIFKIVH